MVVHEATLFFPFPDDTAQALAGALLPETRHGDEAGDVPKTRTRVELADGGLHVHVQAEDLSSLRAAVNSYLRWVDAAMKAAEIGQR